MIIGLVGMPASGKSTAAERFEEHKIKRIYLGDFIWKFLKKKGIKRSQDTGMMAGLALWASYDDIPIMQWAEKQMKKYKKQDFFILDSLRTETEHEFLKMKHDNYFLVAVVTNSDIRFQREKKRSRFREKINYEDFRRRDKEELRMGIGNLIARADFYIDANNSISDVNKQVDEIVKKLIPEPEK